MLKNVPKQLTPELLEILSLMVYGDELVICGADFPAARLAARGIGVRVLRMEDADVAMLLDAMLPYFPLWQGKAVFAVEPEDYMGVLYKHGYGERTMERIETEEFLRRADQSAAIALCSTPAAQYGVIIKKGLVGK